METQNEKRPGSGSNVNLRHIPGRKEMGKKKVKRILATMNERKNIHKKQKKKQIITDF